MCDKFKQSFKYYKSKESPPSFSRVIFAANLQEQNELIELTQTTQNADSRCALLGLTETSNWQSYTFRNHPGLFCIKNAFSGLGQRFWIKQCLEQYPRKPNKTNIDNEVVIDNWWLFCRIAENKDFIKKLRWTTLGFHHDWNSKVYSNNARTKFPDELAELCDIFACYLGFEEFKSEAAIVNYYHMDSTLAAHTDHSEVNLDAPLFSISFGQSAIFLIGGQDKAEEPSAILLQSGDVIIMSASSRLCFHAVPRIIPAQFNSWDSSNATTISNTDVNFKYINDRRDIVSEINCCRDDSIWRDFGQYVDSSRINMNVRQVLKIHQDCITSSCE